MPSDRRSFLTRLSLGLAAAAAVPRDLLARTGAHVNGSGPATATPGPHPAAPPGATRTAGRAPAGAMIAADGLPTPPPGPLPQAFWEELRREFLIPEDEAFFNTGTLGSSPRVVLDAVVDHMTHVDRDIAHWDYYPDHEQYFTGYAREDWLREKIAALINAETDEIALTQNATFGMNYVANGLDLELSDEIVVMEGAHVGGRCGWELRDKRYGAHVRYVPVPVPPEEPQQLIDAYLNATGPHTRVWAIPHLTSGTAVRFPVEEMCRIARERGIFTIVDGAQTCGHLAIDVQAMGCDAYFTSPHKWLLAPKGTGFLYVRKDALPNVWTTLASGEWNNYDADAYRLMQVGTGNLSLLIGFGKALDFHAAIGSERVERRILGLADRLRAGLAEIPGVEIRSPTHPALRSATTIWMLDGMENPDALQDELWERSKVRVRGIGDNGVRQCCHIYTLEADVDRTLETVREIAATT